MKTKKLLFLAMTLFVGLFTSQAYADVTITVGGVGANYATLKTAFDDINAGAINTGVITLQITGNTYELATATLNANAVGSALYSYVKIYPTVTGLSISGNLSSSLITLNGADNVILDGRVHATSGSLTGTTRDLTITNSGGSDLTKAYTIILASNAQHNTIEYCTIKGSGTSSGMGTIAFTTSSSDDNGNGLNIISNNLITNAGTRPYNSIYSGGGSGVPNAGNTISNNEFADFMMPNSISAGIYLDGAYNTAWTISGNSFYESAPFTTITATSFCVIQIKGGTGYTITGNYIGGSSALCGGSPWIKTGSNNVFIGIALTLTPGEPASEVQGNIIQNFVWNNSSNGAWTGINIAAGNVNNTGNTIGANDGTTESIIYTAGAASGGLNGFSIQSSSATGIINMQNNIIGSITTDNTAATPSATGVNGVNITNVVVGTVTFNNNTINNITTSSLSSTGAAQTINGIYNGSGNLTLTISGNTIANLTNATTNATLATTSEVNGIKSANGTNTITNNIIHDLTIANANNNAPISTSVCGILLSGVNGVRTVTGNTIYNLYNTYPSFAGYICGIIFYGASTTNTVDHNFIYNLGVTGASSTTAKVYGIRATGYAGSTTTYSDNIITLGGNTATTIHGINEGGGTAIFNNNFYFNTVYIGGSLASGSTNKSYCLNSSASTNTRDFRNNIFVNARSTTSRDSLQYVAWFNYAVSTNLTLDYNDYYVSGTGGMLGHYGYVSSSVPGTDVTSVPLIAGLDAASLAINPTFATAGGTTAVNYYTSATLPAVTGTGITTDYLGFTRPVTPKMGALETLTSEVNNVEITSATIIRNASGIIVPLNGESTIALYTISGMLIEKTKANRTYSRDLNNGMYIICINGKASRFIK